MDLTGMLQAAAGAAGDAEIVPLGVDFDGTNDYLSRSSDLTGNGDGKTFTFSAWIYKTDATGYVYSSGTSNEFIIYTSNDRVSVLAKNSGGTYILSAETGTNKIPRNTWTHILISMDLSNASNRYIYVNDVSQSITASTYTNDNINFTNSSHEINTSDNSNDIFGRLAGVYLDYTYRDLSVEVNRRLFIDDNGLYVTPPTTGIISVPMDDPADPGRNDGTGGNFTLNGVVARSGRGPNQYNAVYSDFDGSNDFLSRTTNVTGIADSKLVTVHFIVKGDDFSLTPNIILFSDGAGAPKFYAVVTPAGKLQLVAWNAANSIILNVITTTTLYVGKNYSIEVSIDLSDTGKRYIYINGEAAGVTWTTYTDDFIDFTLASPRVRIGCDRNTAPSAFWNGSIGDVYFDTQYIDLSASNPFYDTETDKPKFLGTTGELPTGSAPLIYLPMYASSAGTNLGTGGDFTVNSGPYVGARGPSEFWADSVKGNGTSSYLLNSSVTSVPASSKVFTMAFAFQYREEAYQFEMVNSGGSQIMYLAPFAASNKPMIIVNAGLYVYHNTTITFGNTWYLCLCSVDMSDTNKRHFYVNGVSNPVWDTYTDTTLPWADIAQMSISARVNASSFDTGEFGFIYFDAVYTDFSQEVNRLKFYDAFNNPVDLGADGSVPTGSQPFIYMYKDIYLGTNLGSGGNFTPQNTPTDGGYVNG
jgi:hypothetical protein